ncbi:MAG: nicotinate-nicotinamide nucleotide adenylyltransferase, partial [bacterium]|nr:nicotinate-nicotinamide nucleotide adenylyltransferase [bacterium]
MRIGILGGSFDPPHKGHQALVSSVLRRKLFDEVWYLPAAVHDPQFDKPQMLSGEHRLAMLELVVADHKQKGEAVRIESHEIDQKKEGFTHRTLRELAAKYPQHELRFIIGSDQLAKLHLWGCDLEEACFPKVFTEFDWYVYPRGGSPITQLPFDQLKIISGVEPMEVSSTEVRKLVREAGSIEGKTLDEV